MLSRIPKIVVIKTLTMNVMLNIMQFIALFLCRHQCAGDAMSMIKSQCPFTSFCTDGPQKILTDDADKTPCCMQCSCDANCQQFDTCCPDAIYIQNEETWPVVCLTLVFEYTRKLISIDHSFDLKYRIIASCPMSYTDADTVIKCVNSSQIEQDSFDDIVVVSSVFHHDRLFKNKHCATCNGVMDVLRWDAEAFNCEPRPSAINISRSKLFDFYLTHCDIRSKPGSNIRLSPLSMCMTNILSCNETGLWDKYDGQLEKLCHASYNPYFALHSNSIGPRQQIPYKNVACFLCNHADVTMFEDECYDVSSTSRGINSNFYNVLDFTLTRTKPNAIQDRNWKCNDWEIFDNIMGICRNLKCPPNDSPYYGRCIPNAKITNGEGVIFMLRLYLFEPIAVEVAIRTGEITLVVNRMLRMIKLGKCTKWHMEGKLIKNLNGSNVVEIIVYVEVATNHFCQLDDIANGIAQLENTRPIAVTLAGMAVHMTASLEFTTNKSDIYRDPDFKLKYVSRRSRKSMLFNPNTMCPYITMDKTEYSDYVEARMGSTHTNYNVSKGENDNGSRTTNLLPGFFELNVDHKTQVAGCVDNIWPKYDNSVTSLYPCIMIVLCTMLSQL